MKVILSLGSNLGDRFSTLKTALGHTAQWPSTTLLRAASFYETTPVGYLDQPPFLNTVCELETALSPEDLLARCLALEAALGRVRSFPNAPRTLDIDILLAEHTEIHTETLVIPHPRMRERAFVLVPLQELYPDGQVFGFDLSQDMARVDKSGVKKI